jgi:hypothetical protein
VGKKAFLVPVLQQLEPKQLTDFCDGIRLARGMPDEVLARLLENMGRAIARRKVQT